MVGPEGYNMPEPLEAVAYPTPEKQATFPNPDLYDLDDPDKAWDYLVEVHNGKFELPLPRGKIDTLTGNHISYKIQQVERAALHQDGRHQNDAEHSYAAAHTGIEVAGRLRSDLDLGKLAIMFVRHDNLESYSEDTSIFDKEALLTKEPRERAARAIILAGLKDNPRLAALDAELVAAQSPEARFVKGWDSVEAGLHALNTKCILQAERQDDFVEMIEKQLTKASIDRTAFLFMVEIDKELGRKWHEWGCVSFDGDPGELVDSMARQVMEQQFARVYAFPAETVTSEANRPSQRVVDETVVGKLGVTVLAEWRAKKDKPTPPTPPAPPAFGIAAAAAM